MGAKPEPTTLTKNRIDKAGKYLRDLDKPDHQFGFDRYLDSMAAVQSFRDAHAYPMLKVRVSVQRFLGTAKASGVVTQRHKRVPRILRKLRRMRDSPSGGSGLYRMQDIGGCRAVLDTPEDLDLLAAHIRKRWGREFVKSHDYIDRPKAMGYRAVHFVVERDERAIEIQLRTRGQQEWAEAVESADSRISGVNLKDEQGPSELLDYFHAAGEVIHKREYGLDVSGELAREFDRARAAVIDAGYYSG